MLKAPQILFITPQLPSPTAKGNGRTWRLLSNLGREYPVTLACPAGPEDAGEAERVVSLLELQRYLLAPASGVAYSEWKKSPGGRHRPDFAPAPPAAHALKQLIAEVAAQYDVIIVDHHDALCYLSDVPKTPEQLRVYHAHSAVFRCAASTRRFAPLSLRGLAFRHGAKVALRQEIDGFTACDLVFAADEDLAVFANNGVPLGKLSASFNPHLNDNFGAQSPLIYSTTAKKLLYQGYLGDADNVASLIWFLREVWPGILTAHSDVAFDIVGRDPDLRLLEVAASYPGINFYSSTLSSYTRCRDSRVLVEPLLHETHGGAKLENALLRGIPTVTTVRGLELSHIPPNEAIIAAGNARGMAHSINQLLSDSLRWKQVRQHAESFSLDPDTSNIFFQLREALQPRCAA
ncbi:glycosyltransferase [bacterium]|nr:glycosyltransferase [bacterium]